MYTYVVSCSSGSEHAASAKEEMGVFIQLLIIIAINNNNSY